MLSILSIEFNVLFMRRQLFSRVEDTFPKRGRAPIANSNDAPIFLSYRRKKCFLFLKTSLFIFIRVYFLYIREIIKNKYKKIIIRYF